MGNVFAVDARYYGGGDSGKPQGEGALPAAVARVPKHDSHGH